MTALRDEVSGYCIDLRMRWASVRMVHAYCLSIEFSPLSWIVGPSTRRSFNVPSSDEDMSEKKNPGHLKRFGSTDVNQLNLPVCCITRD